MANRWGNNGNSEILLFSWAPKSLQMVTAAMKLRCLLLQRKALTNLDGILKSKDITLLIMVCIVQLSHPYMTTGKTMALLDRPLSAK